MVYSESYEQRGTEIHACGNKLREVVADWRQAKRALSFEHGRPNGDPNLMMTTVAAMLNTGLGASFISCAQDAMIYW